MKMYLRLFHGRDTLTEDMKENGYGGPCIGPLEYCQTTYCCSVRLEFLDWKDKLKFFEADPHAKQPWDTEAWLWIEGDCIEYQGKYYGDWSCFLKEETDENF